MVYIYIYIYIIYIYIYTYTAKHFTPTQALAADGPPSQGKQTKQTKPKPNIKLTMITNILLLLLLIIIIMIIIIVASADAARHDALLAVGVLQPPGSLFVTWVAVLV